jgi:hypothetical protein
MPNRTAPITSIGAGAIVCRPPPADMVGHGFYFCDLQIDESADLFSLVGTLD